MQDYPPDHRPFPQQPQHGFTQGQPYGPRYGAPQNGVPQQPQCPSHRFLPMGLPPQQHYTFMQGVGFMRRSPEEYERQALIITSRRLGFAMLLCVVFLYLFRPFASLIVPLMLRAVPFSVTPSVTGLLTTVLTYLAAMLVPFFIYRQRIGIPLEVALPMRAPRASLVVAGTFLTLALSSVGNIAADNLSALLRTVGLYAPQSRVALPTDAGGITLYVLIYAVLSPVLEELVFRGVILQSLRRFGDGFALIISAALFSLVHLDLLSLPYAFLAGLVIGYFVLRTGSLVTGLVIHLANNLFAVLYEALGRGLTPTQGALVSAIVFCFYLVLGLAAFVFAARRDARIFTLIPSQTALSEKAKLRLFSSSGTMLLFLVLTAIIISSGLSTSLHLW